MTAATLAWLDDDDPREFRRWSTAAAIVVCIHAMLIGGYLLWHPPEQEVGDETSVIAIELTAPQIEQQEQPKVEEPPPQQTTTPDAVLPEEKPPEKLEPPTPSPVTTARVEAQAPRVDPSWETLLLKHLRQFQNYPSGARARHEEGVVLLAFSIDRDGHVLSRHVVTSSGHPDLDDEALAVVERAQPLPAFPASMTQAQLDLTWPIRFTLHQ
jgi:protein TonB